MKALIPMHSVRSDPTLFPLLIESLVSDPLWTFLALTQHQDPSQLPQYDLVTIGIQNDKGKPRNVVPMFSSKEAAEEFRLGYDRDVADRLLITHYPVGYHALNRLAKRDLDFVLDHGRDGVVLLADIWRPAYAKYGKGREVSVPHAPLHLFQVADADDFPLLRDRITILLLRIPSIRMAWLRWAPATTASPRQLCLVTASILTFDAERIRLALAMLADDLILPELAYLPVAFGTKDIDSIPERAQMFYSDDLAKALGIPTLRVVQR